MHLSLRQYIIIITLFCQSPRRLAQLAPHIVVCLCIPQPQGPTLPRVLPSPLSDNYCWDLSIALYKASVTFRQRK